MAACPSWADAQKADSDVVAEVAGRKITQGELHKALGTDLYDLQRRIYDLKQEKLDGLIGQILLEKEAAKRKMTVEQLLNKYVHKQVRKIRDKDVEKFYNENKTNLRGSKQQYEERIRGFLEQKEKQSAYQKYLDRLKKMARAKIYLEAPKRFKMNLSLTEGASRGKEHAKVHVVEFSDFECPYCGRAAQALERIYKKYKRYVKFTFKAFPLAQHTHAQLAHQASLCAHDQKKFWPYHDKLFENPKKLGRPDLERYAKDLKLDITAFTQCLDSGEKFAMVQKELKEGEAAGVRATPTIFVNGQMLRGADPKELEEVINEELKLH